MAWRLAHLIHDTTDVAPTNMLFGWELHPHRDLIFGAPWTREATKDYAADLVKQLHIHNFAHQHLKVASDWMKASYDKLANSAGFQEGNRVWLYRPTQKRGK
jgi:hypothetical protein